MLRPFRYYLLLLTPLRTLFENERLIGLKDDRLQTGHSDDIVLSTDFHKEFTFLVSL